MLPPSLSTTDQVTLVLDVPVTLAWKTCLEPGLSVTSGGSTATAMLPVATTISVAVAIFETSARLCAVMRYVPAERGAVTVPSGATVPRQSIDQRTRVSVVPPIMAVNRKTLPAFTVAVFGSTEIEISPGLSLLTETVALADFPRLAWLVAVT